MALTKTHSNELIEVVREASRQEILPRFRHLSPEQIETKSSPWDLVTDADRAAEAAIAAAVKKILPKAAFVGEEAVASRPDLLLNIDQADTCIIVDPVDGTSNFAAGLAVFGVILAVVEKGKTVFGLLYDPVMDDWVSAHRGEGAWYVSETSAPQRLSTRLTRPLNQSSGLVPLGHCDDKARTKLMQQFAPVSRLSTLSCSCHEYRLLASGEIDFLVSSMLNPWDHAAGQLVLQEAGGWSRVEKYGDYSPVLQQGKMVAASTSDLGVQIADIYLQE
jgi:fructose-1,6-bisphosphatase/inositol monophosphatase family enzyme